MLWNLKHIFIPKSFLLLKKTPLVRYCTFQVDGQELAMGKLHRWQHHWHTVADQITGGQAVMYQGLGLGDSKIMIWLANLNSGPVDPWWTAHRKNISTTMNSPYLTYHYCKQYNRNIYGLILYNQPLLFNLWDLFWVKVWPLNKSKNLPLGIFNMPTKHYAWLKSMWLQLNQITYRSIIRNTNKPSFH